MNSATNNTHVHFNSPATYRRVTTSEDGIQLSAAAPAGTTPAIAASTSPRSSSSSSSNAATTLNLSERLADKAIAFLYVAVAVLVGHYTNTVQVLLHPLSSSSNGSSSSNALLLQLAYVGFGIDTVLLLYLTVYLPYWKGLGDSSVWAVYCPRVIPTMTLVTVVTGFVLVRAVWPVWGFLSPLILAVEALGCLFALHFVPAWPQ
jgi:hypothetical protein